MGFTIEQECPQCGAPVDLDETDHLLLCPYCGVKHFLFVPGYFRFALPHKTANKKMIYAPYLRFKGSVYFCQNRAVGYRVVDITHVGLPFRGIPASLGVRPQAMKMKFLTADTGSTVLEFSLKATDILAKAGELSSVSSPGRIFHRAYIGETLSLIYLPLFVEGNMLFDAVLNRPIATLSKGEDIFGLPVKKNPGWGLTFIPTLCPQCGWNLDGERDSVILICRNCETTWQVLKGNFVRVSLLAVHDRGEDTVYLPFWKISAIVKGLEINSFADFVRVTNQPKAVVKAWENQDMSFWSPAFKISPKIFLRLSRQLTISQKHFVREEALPKKNLYPVTLPQTEAVQSMKLTLASSALNKKKILPLLPSIRFDIENSVLVYLPFTDTGHEMVQQDTQVSINKNALRFGRQL